MPKILCLIIICVITLGAATLASPVQALTRLPRSSTTTLSTTYQPNPSPNRVTPSPSPSSAAAKKKSLSNFIMTSVVPGVLGSLGAVATGAAAWFFLYQKNQNFNRLFQQTSSALATYKHTPSPTQHDKQEFAKLLTGIEEQAESLSAYGKLTAEHLTALSNKIKRIRKEENLE